MPSVRFARRLSRPAVAACRIKLVVLKVRRLYRPAGATRGDSSCLVRCRTARRPRLLRCRSQIGAAPWRLGGRRANHRRVCRLVICQTFIMCSCNVQRDRRAETVRIHVPHCEVMALDSLFPPLNPKVDSVSFTACRRHAAVATRQAQAQVGIFEARAMHFRAAVPVIVDPSARGPARFFRKFCVQEAPSFGRSITRLRHRSFLAHSGTR